MKSDITVEKLIRKVERASTDFERANTDTKRKYLIWNIEAFNIIAKAVSVNRGSFGTGYPFYVLDKNLEGEIPIITEQIRYNRQLVADGKPVQKSIWQCKACLERNYKDMPDLKQICKPCPNVRNEVKPRKLINRLPDLDMWLICKDGCIEQAQIELAELLEKNGMRTSDVDPLESIEDVSKIAKMIKQGTLPAIFLPIDSHIMEYSAMKDLIEKVPKELRYAKKHGTIPYLPIRPTSYRKTWQYDDEAYNFIYDYLSAFTTFNVPKELQQALEQSRKIVVQENTPEELLGYLMQSSTPANYRRFQTPKLQDYFLKRVKEWQTQIETSTPPQTNKKEEDQFSL